MSGLTSLKISNIVLGLIPASPGCEFHLEDAYRGFIAEEPPDVNLRVYCGRLPDMEFGRKVFNSGGNWILHRDRRKKWAISLHSPVLGASPYRLVVLEDDFCAGDIYVQSEGPNCRRVVSPLEHPLDQVLMVHLLARGRGVLLHACGLSWDGRGIILAGVSGAGKSTLANLWRGRGGVTLLSDDRIVVRESGGRFWAYGTPWHGNARAASPLGVPLERIFVIRHAAENTAARLAPADAAARLLVRSFSTFWDAPGMAFTLEFLDKLSQAVPCYDLGFVPDASVVEFVQCLP
jgi:hypothetical protein